VKLLALGMFVIAAMALSAMLDPESGLEIWLELRRDLAVSDTRVERLVRENEALRGEIATLESEPDAIDRAIREELDLALPGEVVVRFEAPPSGSPADPQEGSAPGQRSPAQGPLKQGTPEQGMYAEGGIRDGGEPL
jgi:cell division protein FtsB